MRNYFFASDHHFGHANMLNFTRADEVTPVRSFASVEEMDEYMIERHNSVVGPNDRVYFLGDLAIPRRGLQQVKRLNGKKRLIMGNHDVFKNKDYYDCGIEVLGAFRKFDDFVVTHIPVHSDSISKRWFRNVHGHTHTNNVKLPRGVNARTGEIMYSDKDDPHYICVCVEQLDNYTPIHIDDLRKRFK